MRAKYTKVVNSSYNVFSITLLVRGSTSYERGIHRTMLFIVSYVSFYYPDANFFKYHRLMKDLYANKDCISGENPNDVILIFK